ncbi:MAG: acetyltransferase [Solirubrobacterales bacterium]|nr:acetyltransferase [Solirubrobacterales bacterium]
MSTHLLERLQAGSVALAGSNRETVRVAPFTAFVDARRSLKYFSYAVPDQGAGAEAAASLEALAAAFSERGRTGRIELVEELTPALPAAVEAAGWSLSERVPIMVCTSDSLVIPPVPEGIEVIVPDAGSPEDVIAGWHRTLGIAFGDEKEIEAAEIEVWRERAPTSFYAAALSEGEVIGTAAGAPLSHGNCEIGAVATLPAYRRRGIAGHLTAEATAAAFAAGAEIVWLTSAPEAERIYAQAGFSVVGHAANYDAP